MEKLATQVIKNLQVKISSIHLRYEDDVSSDEAQAQNDLKVTFRPVLEGGGEQVSAEISCTCFLLQLSDPQRPVCVGVTLSEMSLQVQVYARTHVHADGATFAAVLCFRPPTRTGRRAS